jgi:hypothetical protein
MFQNVNADNVEEMLIYNKKEIENIKNKNQEVDRELNRITEELKKAYSKTAVYKYNAFEGMGGQLSFVYVVLNNLNNGFIFNGIYSNEGHYLYLKEILNGKCDKELSKEEKTTLEKIL